MKKKIVVFFICMLLIGSVGIIKERVKADEDTMIITSLKCGSNLFTLPFNAVLNIENIKVSYGGIEYTWADAISYPDPIVVGFIYMWNRITQSYFITYTLESGQGYWMYAFYDCDLFVEGTYSTSDEYITDFSVGWNLIGLPYDEPLIKERLVIDDGVDTYDWEEATTGDPHIIGYIYDWDREDPKYLELVNVLNPGYGYWMYAFEDCDLLYSDTPCIITPIDVEWEATLQFYEPGGTYPCDSAYDTVTFGEVDLANDGPPWDIYDVPRTPPNPNLPSFIFAYFDDGLSSSAPYRYLMKDYRQYPDIEKVWDLWVLWYWYSPRSITISWVHSEIVSSGYSSVVLYDADTSVQVADMLDVTSYTFNCPALTLRHFQIICISECNIESIIAAVHAINDYIQDLGIECFDIPPAPENPKNALEHKLIYDPDPSEQSVIDLILSHKYCDDEPENAYGKLMAVKKLMDGNNRPQDWITCSSAQDFLCELIDSVLDCLEVLGGCD